MSVHRGGCHCGAITFEVDGEIRDVEQCNCSICTKKGYLHWYVDPAQFRLLTSPDAMETYRFNTGVARHHFCRVCGVAPFYLPRSDPDRIDVNVRCIENVDFSSLRVRSFDGRNWEEAHRKARPRQT